MQAHVERDEGDTTIQFTYGKDDGVKYRFSWYHDGTTPESEWVKFLQCMIEEKYAVLFHGKFQGELAIEYSPSRDRVAFVISWDGKGAAHSCFSIPTAEAIPLFKDIIANL